MIKATLKTLLVMLLVMLFFIYYIFSDDIPLNDAESWGFFIMAFGLIFTFINVAIGFPIAGKLSLKLKNVNCFNFIIFVILTNVLFSILSAVFFDITFYGLSLTTLTDRGLKMFILNLFVCLPFSMLWWKFAKLK